jgi:flagellar L-ring protein precursor FlgH
MMTMRVDHRLAAALLTLGLTALAAAGNRQDELVLATRMYSSQRAARIGDLLTIVVSEQTASSKSDSLSTSKEASATSQMPSFGSETGERDLTQELSNLEVPAFSVDSESEYSGSGSAATSESLTTSMTVRVVDVHRNNLLVIRGERLVKIKKERVKMVLTGLVRPRDVDSDNTVASQRISDFRVAYESEGHVSNASRPGWLWRFLQFINPF